MVNESGNPTEKLTEKEKLKKRFPDFSDEEVQERLETTKLLKEGKITDDEYAEKIDTLGKKSKERHKQEQTKQELETGEQKTLEEKKEITKEEQAKKAEELKKKELNEPPPTEHQPSTPPNTPVDVAVKSSSLPPSETAKKEKEDTEETPKNPSKSLGGDDKKKKDEPKKEEADKKPDTSDKNTEEQKSANKTESSNKKTGSLGLFGGLATIPGAIADRTKGRDSSNNYLKNFLRFASFPTTVAARTTQWGLNLVGDTFRGIFTPKSRTRPRKVNRKEKYTKTSSTRKKLWTSSESTSDKK